MFELTYYASKNISTQYVCNSFLDNNINIYSILKISRNIQDMFLWQKESGIYHLLHHPFWPRFYIVVLGISFSIIFLFYRGHILDFFQIFFYAYLWILLLFFTVLLDEDNDVYKDNEKEDKNFKLKHSEKKMILDQNSSQASDASSTRQTRQKKAARNNSESSNGMICQSI